VFKRFQAGFIRRTVISIFLYLSYMLWRFSTRWTVKLYYFVALPKHWSKTWPKMQPWWGPRNQPYEALGFRKLFWKVFTCSSVPFLIHVRDSSMNYCSWKLVPLFLDLDVRFWTSESDSRLIICVEFQLRWKKSRSREPDDIFYLLN